MARTSSGAVALILRNRLTHPKGAGDYDGVTDLDPYIETASAKVDDLVECAALDDVTFTAARLELIERWLAAHYYACADQTLASRSTGGASGSFHGQTGMGLQSTRYGQAALDLDSTGCLAGGSEEASSTWLGLPPSEQTDYVDRD